MHFSDDEYEFSDDDILPIMKTRQVISQQTLKNADPNYKSNTHSDKQIIDILKNVKFLK